jgi:hypothetical protein
MGTGLHWVMEKKKKEGFHGIFLLMEHTARRTAALHSLSKKYTG